MNNNNIEVFYALIRSGLWGEKVSLAHYHNIDFNIIHQISTEQSVVGVVVAGLENVIDIKVPQDIVLVLAGEVMQIEQRNASMNVFIADLIDKMRNAGIYTILVKGQGLAQCYRNPLWRSCGDVDLLLSSDNYDKAKSFLIPLSTSHEPEREQTKHLGMVLNGWDVELHGTLRSALWRRFNTSIDNVQRDVFYGGKVRSWMNGNTQVFLPGVDEDVFFVFSHILQHFYNGGIGLRQVCDWCRLLWTYKDKIDIQLLGLRLKEAEIEKEWKAFGAFAVDHLGMPIAAMPLYEDSRKWHRRANKLCALILESGNFGHNKDFSYEKDLCGVKRKIYTFKRFSIDCAETFAIFPMNSLKIWMKLVTNGLRSAMRGE